jgi:hypothetical protein
MFKRSHQMVVRDFVPGMPAVSLKSSSASTAAPTTRRLNVPPLDATVSVSLGDKQRVIDTLGNPRVESTNMGVWPEVVLTARKAPIICAGAQASRRDSRVWPILVGGR